MHIMQGARSGFRALQRLACTQQQQRCVGSASKLFPDQSEVMGASRPAERGDIGECSGVPSEILNRVVSLSHGSMNIPNHAGAATRVCGTRSCSLL